MSDALPSDARVFAIASGKGGVGKTTTAVNVAAALAESGAETVVLDADLGMANVADLLDLSASPTLQDVLAGELTVEEATHRTDEGLAVVPGSTDLDSYGEIEPERLREVVATLREEFEYVFLDAGAGLSLDSALPLGLADAVVLVTTPRETATRDAGKTRELADRIDATVGGVVVTRVRKEPGELGPVGIAKRVGTTVLTAVPEDGSVREALSAGRPIVTHAPESPVTTAYRRLGAALTGREAVEPAADSNESSDGDATSIEELLEREADRSTDVSTLTGDPPSEPESDDVPEPDETVESDPDDADGATPDEPPTLELEGEGVRPDPLADDSGQSTDPLAVDEGHSENAGSDDEPTIDGDDSDAGAETDGDIPTAGETPPDDGSPNDATDSTEETDTTHDSSTDEGDPMADIPRFDDDSDEEFERGTAAGDPLAADPLVADPLGTETAGDLESDDDRDSLDEDEAGTDGSETGGIDGSSEADDTEEAKPGDGNAVEATDGDEEERPSDGDDEGQTGPRVEMDDPEDDRDRSGILGRLTGLFR